MSAEITAVMSVIMTSGWGRYIMVMSIIMTSGWGRRYIMVMMSIWLAVKSAGTGKRGISTDTDNQQKKY
jgi:hypothetical protein